MARPQHRYQTCQDDACPSLLCRAYKEGYQDGYEDGQATAEGQS
jgi:hypothetical protein